MLAFLDIPDFLGVSDELKAYRSLGLDQVGSGIGGTALLFGHTDPHSPHSTEHACALAMAHHLGSIGLAHLVSIGRLNLISP